MEIALIHLEIYLRSEIASQKTYLGKKIVYSEKLQRKKNLYAEIQAGTQFSGAKLSPGI